MADVGVHGTLLGREESVACEGLSCSGVASFGGACRALPPEARRHASTYDAVCKSVQRGDRVTVSLRASGGPCRGPPSPRTASMRPTRTADSRLHQANLM
ncbi:hypothetical protein Cco03nite_56260 [Catellatospora coxensis]|uniref:Uncharacterized protein n=1 Tax=Catellatospora coxensis TaxID=310354 RepID=A0A8J3P966_9ACTN|nr:hypothetical protein Cco03nite_56260 [Catellatospora coxensis]